MKSIRPFRAAAIVLFSMAPLVLAQCGTPRDPGAIAATSGASAGRGNEAGRAGAGATPSVSGAGQGGASSGGAISGGSAGVGMMHGGAAGAGAGGTLAGSSGAASAGSTSAGGVQAVAGTNGSGSGGNGAAGAGGATASAFMLGADVSSMQEAMDKGARFFDTDGTEKPLLMILKAHGFNTLRLRSFVEPDAPYGYAAGTEAACAKIEAYCDTAHTVEVAQQVKALGMRWLLDLHYSDNWADPGKQIVPRRFRAATTVVALAAEVKAYTKEVLTALAASGALPDMVQVGNEITPGMLMHVPNTNTDCWGNNVSPASVNGSAARWNDLATLLRAGIEGVREVDASIDVMLHIENTDELAGVRSWVTQALARGVDFDVLGLSCYTAFQGQPSVWRTTFESMAAEFPMLAFAIAEYNPERSEANRIIKGLPDGRGRGTFFWEPTLSGTWGSALFTVSGQSYRADARAFAEIDALRVELGL
jgi:arabinogalactan endo-1,4-beta-galactosidase